MAHITRRLGQLVALRARPTLVFPDGWWRCTLLLRGSAEGFSWAQPRRAAPCLGLAKDASPGALGAAAPALCWAPRCSCWEAAPSHPRQAAWVQAGLRSCGPCDHCRHTTDLLGALPHLQAQGDGGFRGQGRRV